jgi:glutamate transport system substrate-binding protein
VAARPSAERLAELLAEIAAGDTERHAERDATAESGGESGGESDAARPVREAGGLGTEEAGRLAGRRGQATPEPRSTPTSETLATTGREDRATATEEYTRPVEADLSPERVPEPESEPVSEPESEPGLESGQEPGPETAPGRSRRRRTVVGACVAAVLVGCGWLVWHSAAPGTDDPKKHGPGDSLRVLEEARSGHGKLVIGVKDHQPGLSSRKEGSGKGNGGWSGAEVEYAWEIVDHLGIEKRNVQLKPVGTSTRAQRLDDGSLNMVIGTYGISKARKKGTTPNEPPVDFAGPYFKTPQKIMLQKYPGAGDPYDAMVHGDKVSVKSLSDLPSDARICTADGSTAQIFLQQDELARKFRDNAEYKTDYTDCIHGLKKNVDAVLTDEAILNGFQKQEKNQYVISRDTYGRPEAYGIGVPKGSEGLKREICKALRKSDTTMYKDVTPGAPPGFLKPARTSCRSKPR